MWYTMRMFLRQTLFFILFLILIVSTVSATLDDAEMYISFDANNITGLNPIDLSGNKHNGTGYESATLLVNQTGKLNECFTFVDTTDPGDRVNYSNGDWGLASTDWTISLWAKSTGTGNDRYLFTSVDEAGSQDEFVVNFGFQAGGLKGRVGKNNVNVISWTYDNTSFDVNDGNWHHFVVTFDWNGGSNSVNTVYCDNQLYYSETGDVATMTDDNPYCIGAYCKDDGYAGLSFDGSIDEFAVYKRILTSGERSELWNSGNGYNPYGTAPSPPTINLTYTLNAPENGSDVYDNNVTLNITVLNNYTTSNASFYVKEIVGNSNFTRNVMTENLSTGIEDSGVVYDSTRDLFYIIGGDDGSNDYKDTIQYYNKSSDSYSLLGNIRNNGSSGQLPSSDQCIYSPIQDNIYCYGGKYGKSGSYEATNLTWYFNLTDNEYYNLSIELESPSVYGCANYDSKRDVVYVTAGYDTGYCSGGSGTACYQNQIWRHNLSDNTFTFVANLTQYLFDPGCAYHPTKDVVYYFGGTRTTTGTKNSSSKGYWNGVIEFNITNLSIKTINDSALPYAASSSGADSLTCEYMQSDEQIYCFGNIASSQFAPYTYRDDILVYNITSQRVSLSDVTILDDDEDFGCALDTSVNNSIYCFALLKAGSNDNVIANKIRTAAFTVNSSLQFVLKDTQTNISNGTDIIYNWILSSYGDNYQWYVYLSSVTTETTSDIFFFDYVENDCIYSSGDWVIDSSCTIDSNTDYTTNTFTCSNNAIVRVQANVKGGTRKVTDGCVVITYPGYSWIKG